MAHMHMHMHMHMRTHMHSATLRKAQTKRTCTCTCMAHAWYVHGTCMVRAWHTQAKPSLHRHVMHGTCMAYVGQAQPALARLLRRPPLVRRRGARRRPRARRHAPAPLVRLAARGGAAAVTRGECEAGEGEVAVAAGSLVPPSPLRLASTG
eukprot:scaffold73354_cov62-Phaeocystis_antarctica.AAC.1